MHKSYIYTAVTERYIKSKLMSVLGPILTKPNGDNPWCSFSGESKPEQQPALWQITKQSKLFSKYILSINTLILYLLFLYTMGYFKLQNTLL